MRNIVTLIIIIIMGANTSHAFEMDGLKSGITMEVAKRLLESYSYKNIKKDDHSIIASDQTSGESRLIALSFCKNKLVQVQKHLIPRFDNFTRLVNDKRKEFGKPVDAWSEPTDVTSNFESNAVSFLWRDGPTFIKISYTEFKSNNQFDITYAIKNICWELPY